METILLEIGETAHALRKSFDRRASALGTTRAQWKVLLHLNRTPGLRQVELADLLDIEPITLCRILDRLEESGLVERSQDPADRRAHRLHITDRAQPLIEKLQALGAELATEAFAGIEPDDVATARKVLARIRENVGRSSPINRALINE
jgi:DNA-binding MarR family transcriptional regulator